MDSRQQNDITLITGSGQGVGGVLPSSIAAALHTVTAQKSALSVKRFTRNRRKGLGDSLGSRRAACRLLCLPVSLWACSAAAVRAETDYKSPPRCVALVLAVLVSIDAPSLNIKYSENGNFHLGEFLFTRGAVGGRSSLGE